MNKYGIIAVKTVEMLDGKQRGKDPRDVWEKIADEEFGPGSSSASKVCPKSTFLSLCECGLIVGIPEGKYTRSTKNKKHALDAVEALQKKPSLGNSPEVLWDNIVSSKAHNSQMDVVIALWNKNYIIKK